MWIWSRPKEASETVRTAGDKIESGAREIGEGVSKGVRGAADEMDRTRVREKLRETGDTVSTASRDTVITTRVKAKFAEDSGVSALRIHVDTTDGVVTLSGRASTAEEVDRAVQLAKTVDGVKRVESTLQVGNANP